MKGLNWGDNFLGGEKQRNLYLHIILTVIILIASCIQGIEYFFSHSIIPSKLSFVSWLGIFALVVSILVVDMYACVHVVKNSYGIINFAPRITKEVFLFTNMSSFVKSIGIAPYTIGFNFCFLTFYVPLCLLCDA